MGWLTWACLFKTVLKAVINKIKVKIVKTETYYGNIKI